MTSDPNLNKALEEILSTLSEKRFGSVPPLERDPKNSTKAPSKANAKTKPAASSASVKPKGRQPVFKASRTRSVGEIPDARPRGGRQSAPLITPGSSKAASPARSATSMSGKVRLTPLGNGNGLPGSEIDPRTQIHTKDCFLYQERIADLVVKGQQRLIAAEYKARQKLRQEETEVFAAERTEFIEVGVALRLGRNLNTSMGDMSATQRLSLDPETIGLFQVQVYALLKKDKEERKVIRAKWEVGFDEIAAVMRLGIRQIIQVQEMRDAAAAKKEREETAEQDRKHRDTVEKFIKKQDLEREVFLKSEDQDRYRCFHMEEKVREGIMDIYDTQRRAIVAHDMDVRMMHVKHSQRLMLLNVERDKCLTDEKSQREKLVQNEKKAFELMHILAPESKQKAKDKYVARGRRERREVNDCLESEFDKRTKITNTEAKERDAIMARYNDEHAAEIVADSRRMIRYRRRLWREVREKRSSERMLEEDNHAWNGIRFRYESSIVHGALEEEKAARIAMNELKMFEKATIIANLRALVGLAQAESRVRSEQEKEEQHAFDVILEEIRASKDTFTCEWCESLMRRYVILDYDKMSEDLERMQAVLLESVTVMKEYPKASIHRPHTNDDLPFNLWLRQSSVLCFFGSEGCKFLEGSTLKTKEQMASSVTTIDEPITVTAEILNPVEGDQLSCVSASSRNTGPHSITVGFHGDFSTLVDGLIIWSRGVYNKTKSSTRVVNINFGGIEFAIYVTMLAPLVSINESCVESLTIAPLRYFNVPAKADFKSVRCILTMPEESTGDGCHFKFPIPGDFFSHPRNGIMHGGKTQMRVMSQTEERIEFEFDLYSATPSALLRLLASIQLVRGDNMIPLVPLQLSAVLTAKDDSVLYVNQALDLDATVLPSPRLRVPGYEITCRSVCFDTPERLAKHIPSNDQYMFSRLTASLPEVQQDVTGGCLRVSIAESDTKATIAIRPHGTSNVISVQRNVELVCSNDDEKQIVGHVFGNDTDNLTITFLPTTAFGPEILNAIIRSFVFRSNRRTAPRSSHLRPLHVKFFLDCAPDARVEPIKVDFKVTVLPPVIESSNKNSHNFPYREGAGEKILPSMEIKQSTLELGAEARLEVKLLAAPEANERIDVLGAEFDQSEGLYVFRYKSLPVAWWRPREEAGLAKNELSIHLSGNMGITGWMREDPTDPYPVDNFLPSNTTDVQVKGVNVLLHSIVYCQEDCNPKVLKKPLLITLDDGRNGRSYVAYELAIESVDDPTEIVFESKDLTYRQNSLSSAMGMPLFPAVQFEDPDSDNFHGGWITIDHGNGPAEVGDHIYMMDSAQQEKFIHEHGNSSSISCLAHLVETATEEEKEFIDCLTLLADEQPVRLLEVRDNAMFFAGEQIGKVSMKTSSKDGPCYSIKLSFAAESKFVSFEAAQYAMRCLVFENKSPKMKPGKRQYNIKLNCTGTASTTETVERVFVETYLALMATPPSSLQIKYEEGAKPRLLLKQVNTALDDTLHHQGYFKASIRGVRGEGDDAGKWIQDPNDEIFFETTADIKVKDKSMYFGKELVGVSNPRKDRTEDLYVNFGKVNNQSLKAFLRSLVFYNGSRDPVPGQREIEVHCTANTDLEMCSFTITVDFVGKDDPAEIILSKPEHYYMTGNPPIQLMPDTKLVDPDTDVFPKGSRLKVGLTTRQLPGENMIAKTNADTVVRFDEGKVTFTVGGELVAKVSENAKKRDGLVTFMKPIQIDFIAPVSATMIEAIMGTLNYSNSLKVDRGKRKTIEVFFYTPGQLNDRAVVTVDIAPAVLDFAHTPLILQAPSGTAVQLLEGTRVQLILEAAYFDVSVMMVTGHDPGDKLFFDMSTCEYPGLTKEGSSILLANEGGKEGKKEPSKGGKKKGGGNADNLTFANIAMAEGNTVRFKCNSANALAIQALLRAIQVQVSSPVPKEVTVEVLGVCSYGQGREIIRIRV